MLKTGSSMKNNTHKDIKHAVMAAEVSLAAAALVIGGSLVCTGPRLTVYAMTNDGYADGGPGVAQNGDTQPEESESETLSETQEETKAEEESQAQKETETAQPQTTSVSDTEAAAKVTAEPDAAALANDGRKKSFTKVDYSWFADAAFVGDSFTQGLMIYADIPGADCLCYQSKTTRNIMDSDIHMKSGKVSTVRKQLSAKQYGKIYIMLGINELSKDAAGFAQRYQKVINEIRALQPNAIIYIQSIFHTTPKKSANTGFKNDIIDMNNQALMGLADGKTVFYVNVNPPFDDGTGALRSDYSSDGVHLKASHYNEWRDYLLNYGVK